MARAILTDAERLAWERFPAEPDPDVVGVYFTLADGEVDALRRLPTPAGRLATAVALGAIRWLGFVPVELDQAPAAGTQRLASQLEHDSPLGLLRAAVLELRDRRLLRPGLSTLERLVASARAQAERETYGRLEPVLDGATRRALDALCVTDVRLGVSRLVWLGREARSAAPSQIVEQLDKLAYLRELGAERWSLDAVPANRRRQLAWLARRSSTAALAGRPDRLRYPALLCFCQEQLPRLVDEVLDRTDQAIGEAHGRARAELEQLKTDTATAANEKVALFDLLVGLLLDDTVADTELRERAWQQMPPERWAAAREHARQILRPLDDNHFAQLAGKYPHLPRFAPALLGAMRFCGVPAARPLLDAIELLRELDANGRRALRPRRRLGSCPRAGARTSPMRMACSTAAGGSCACSRSCAPRCAPERSGSRRRGATSPPTAT